MNELEFLKHDSIRKMAADLKIVEIAKKTAGYNLFTLSFQSAHLENFHSDIIFSLLNPEGLHGEGNLFLELFIEFLTFSYSATIDVKDYKNVSALREKGRIDLWIKDETSKHCFFIENKINNAPDRENQLLDYYDYAIRNGYTVDAIVYLSLDGSKSAPIQGRDMKSPVFNIPAFSNSNIDLLNGWLNPCVKAAQQTDSRALLIQYCKLITHLSNNHMENDIKEDFYRFVADTKGIDTIRSVKYLIETLPNYRADKFNQAILSDHKPFGNKFKYQNNYYIFEKYFTEAGAFKLDVFFENSGAARVVMWNYVKKEDGGYATVEALLLKIGLRERFNGVSRYTGLTADFEISDEYPDIRVIDEAVIMLVKDIFKRLNNLNHG